MATRVPLPTLDRLNVDGCVCRLLGYPYNAWPPTFGTHQQLISEMPRVHNTTIPYSSEPNQLHHSVELCSHSDDILSLVAFHPRNTLDGFEVHTRSSNEDIRIHDDLRLTNLVPLRTLSEPLPWLGRTLIVPSVSCRNSRPMQNTSSERIHHSGASEAHNHYQHSLGSPFIGCLGIKSWCCSRNINWTETTYSCTVCPKQFIVVCLLLNFSSTI